MNRTHAEWIAVLQMYIFHRKGIEIGNIAIRNPFDLAKLQMGYSEALNWFNANEVKISIQK